PSQADAAAGSGSEANRKARVTGRTHPVLILIRSSGMALAIVALMSWSTATACRKESQVNEGVKPPNVSSPAPAALQLTATAKNAQLSITWKNTSNAALKVATHVFAGEKHFDWLSVTLTDAAGTKRTLVFTDNRDESAPVFVDLAPGATTTETIDLAAWAARAPNAARPVASGRYDAYIVYDTTREQRAWAGRLQTTATVDVP